MNEIFFVNHPAQLLIGQFKGGIVSTETPTVFNKRFGRFAHCRIVGLQNCELYFNNRQSGPHLQLERDQLDRLVANISQEGLVTLAAVEQLRTGEAVRIASLFERYERSYQRACESLKKLASA